MTITIKQRDNEHMSHEAVAGGIELWDVYQGEALVGVYRSEIDALQYKELLESGTLDRLQAHS
ncbi:hypothetical protein [Solimonas marina]|uniref:Uncharacterized protein n=1 Tax=Solimonas marina TaxID=2714601 RepID=A0A969WE89_9GAMM|nr:hypothetical protein [Solimonas marina]NKF24490.1 hypothetical protein [Solimonas marina]